MSDTQIEVAYKFMFWVVYAVFGLLLAFPAMWCWNYAATHAFGAPALNWGHAYCLWVLSGFVKPILMCQHKK